MFMRFLCRASGMRPRSKDLTPQRSSHRRPDLVQRRICLEPKGRPRSLDSPRPRRPPRSRMAEAQWPDLSVAAFIPCGRSKTRPRQVPLYWNVPTIVPSWVSGCCAVAAADARSTTPEEVCFARPKSSSFAPLFVSMEQGRVFDWRQHGTGSGLRLAVLRAGVRQVSVVCSCVSFAAPPECDRGAKT